MSTEIERGERRVRRTWDKCGSGVTLSFLFPPLFSLLFLPFSLLLPPFGGHRTVPLSPSLWWKLRRLFKFSRGERLVWYAISPKSSCNTVKYYSNNNFHNYIYYTHTHTSTHVYLNTHAGSAVNLYKKLLPLKSHSVSPPLTPAHIIYTTLTLTHLTSSTLPLSSPSIYNTIHQLLLPLSHFHHFLFVFWQLHFF